MSNETVGDGQAAGTRDTRRFVWLFDPRLVMTALGSIAVVVLAGLVQVSFGSYSMSVGQAWSAVVNPDVLLNQQAWNSFLLGGELPEMGRKSLIVWSIRLPRVFVAIIVGMNLAISGAIFQAITRNELASPFILGVSSGAGLMILVVLVAIPSFVLAVPFLALTGAQGGLLGGGATLVWLFGVAGAWWYGVERRQLRAIGLVGAVLLGGAFVAKYGN
jgi:iron complex transport system permease protein